MIFIDKNNLTGFNFSGIIPNMLSLHNIHDPNENKNETVNFSSSSNYIYPRKLNAGFLFLVRFLLSLPHKNKAAAWQADRSGLLCNSAKVHGWAVALFFVLCTASSAYANETKASWYSFQSARSEGTSGYFTASKEPFNENAMTCALPHRNWGGLYKVTNLKTGKFVVVRHNDFGPGKKPRSRGVVIDLSKAAFSKIAPLSEGIVHVKVERI